MRALYISAVPCVLLFGLIFGAMKLHSVDPSVAPCTLGSCPLSIYANDSGKTFVYGKASRLTVFLNESDNPKKKLACAPGGIIEMVSNSPAVAPPLYAARFEGVAPGTCTLSDDNFSVRIEITQ